MAGIFCELDRTGIVLYNAELGHSSAEGARIDTKNTSGTVWALDPPVGA